MSAPVGERTCRQCSFWKACRWTPTLTDAPPFLSDTHVGPFIETVQIAWATACSNYLDKDSIAKKYEVR